jgi:hypothetical protein
LKRGEPDLRYKYRKMHPKVLATTRNLEETRVLLLSSTRKLTERGHTAEYLETAAVQLEETSHQFVQTIRPWHRRSWEAIKRTARKWGDYIPCYWMCSTCMDDEED